MQANVKGTTMPVLEMVLEAGRGDHLDPRRPVVDVGQHAALPDHQHRRREAGSWPASSARPAAVGSS